MVAAPSSGLLWGQYGAGKSRLKYQPPQAHFAKRTIPRRKQPKPAKPAINETAPNRNAIIDPSLESASAAPAANSPHTPETTAAPTANSSHTHHSKSLGLKGMFREPFTLRQSKFKVARYPALEAKSIHFQS